MIYLNLRVNLADELPTMPSKDMIEMVRLLCERIHTEGVIEQIRAIVNDPKYDDQEQEAVEGKDKHLTNKERCP